MSRSTSNTPDLDRFVELLTGHQSRLYAFIYAQFADPDQARDVFQETNLVLWRKAAEFDVSREFAPWAFAIARNQIRAARLRLGRNRLAFDDEAVRLIADRMEANDSQLDARQMALATCLERMPVAERDLVRLRYEQGRSLAEIGEKIGRSANAMGVAMHRIRRMLSECISRQVGTGVVS